MSSYFVRVFDACTRGTDLQRQPGLDWNSCASIDVHQWDCWVVNKSSWNNKDITSTVSMKPLKKTRKTHDRLIFNELISQ